MKKLKIAHPWSTISFTHKYSFTSHAHGFTVSFSVACLQLEKIQKAKKTNTSHIPCIYLI